MCYSDGMFYVYRLTFPDAKIYIGCTCDPRQRAATHKGSPKSGQQGSVPQAIAEHGMPTMEILQTGERKEMLALERATIAALRSDDPDIGYNVGFALKSQRIKATLAKSEKAPGAHQKLADLNKARAGKPLAWRHRAKLYGKRKPNSPETREKKRLAALNRSPEHRAKLKAAWKARHSENSKNSIV